MNMPVLGYVHILQISSTVEMTLCLYVLHAMGETHSREEHDLFGEFSDLHGFVLSD